MKLNFDALTLENFGSINSAQTLLLDRSAGLYRMTGRNEAKPRLGPNGVGKSTFWRGLNWTLYGKGTSGLRTPDIQPWSGSKATRGKLLLTRGKHQHTIIRSVSPNRLQIDGKDVTQEDLDRLIGLSMDMFLNAVIYPQSGDLFLDKSPKGKLELLSDGIDLARWEDRSARAGKAASELTRNWERLESELNATIGTLERLEKLLADAKKQSSEWEEERRARAETREKTIAKLSKQLQRVDKLYSAAELAYDSAQSEFRALGKEERAAADKLSGLNAAVASLKSDLTRARRAQNEKRGELSSSGDNCPTCGQPLKGSAHKKHRQTLQTQLDTLDKEIIRLTDEIEAMDATIAAAKIELKKVEDQRNSFQDKADAAESARALHGPQLTEIKTKLRMLTEQVDDTNPHTEQVSNLRRQVSQTSARLDTMSADIKTLKRRSEETQFWVKGFKDVQLYVLAEVLKETEAAANAMLPDVGLDGWEMRFDIERETASGSIQRGVNVSILSPNNNKTVRWECWSGGEGQRLRVIAALALAEVILAYAGVQTNLEVLDEPTRGLSREGTNDLCAFLSDRAQQLGKCTWWVDQQVMENTRFTESVVIAIGAGGTYVAEK